jgi:hypothetical protein
MVTKPLLSLPETLYFVELTETSTARPSGRQLATIEMTTRVALQLHHSQMLRPTVIHPWPSARPLNQHAALSAIKHNHHNYNCHKIHAYSYVTYCTKYCTFVWRKHLFLLGLMFE